MAQQWRRACLGYGLKNMRLLELGGSEQYNDFLGEAVTHPTLTLISSCTISTILLSGKFGSVFLNFSPVLFFELSSRNWRNTSLEQLRFFFLIFVAPLISSVDYDKTTVNLGG